FSGTCREVSRQISSKSETVATLPAGWDSAHAIRLGNKPFAELGAKSEALSVSQVDSPCSLPSDPRIGPGNVAIVSKKWCVSPGSNRQGHERRISQARRVVGVYRRSRDREGGHHRSYAPLFSEISGI